MTEAGVDGEKKRWEAASGAGVSGGGARRRCPPQWRRREGERRGVAAPEGGRGDGSRV